MSEPGVKGSAWDEEPPGVGGGWHLTDERTATPVALLHRSALQHNASLMAQFCQTHGVLLAPHAKTTMSEQLVRLQLDAGAWALTVAVPHQVAVLRGWGVRRILVANEVVDHAALRWIAGELADPAVQISWYVDSLTGVRVADEALRSLHDSTGRMAGVLLELGHAGGRTGARSTAAALEVARAVEASAHLELAGVAGYEGTVATDRAPASLSAVRAYLGRLRELYELLVERGLLGVAQPVVTAGGSVFFDEVSDALGPLKQCGASIVLRSGCYLVHDHGLYERLSPDRTPGWPLAPFRPALEVWGTVVSRPEPELALLNLGRRDVSFDQGLPVPLWRARRGNPDVRPTQGMPVSALSDQHAFLRARRSI